MASGSRLFYSFRCKYELSDTAGSTLAGALGATINGSDYKVHLCYTKVY